MKPKTMILMAVAISCGLGASYMTSRLLAERTSEAPERVKVLVLTKNLNQGDQLKNIDGLFEEKDVLRGQEPASAITDLKHVQGKVLKRSLRIGDFISPDDLVGEREGTLKYSMPDKYRAMGIRVNAESIAAGFASLPHSRVDIIYTWRRGDDRSSHSQILLENVLVLAADQQMQPDASGRAMPANVVTVALKPEDALKVALAREFGPMTLVLRRFNDAGHAEETKVTGEALLNRTESKDKAEIVSHDDSAPPTAKLPPIEPLRKDEAKPAPETTQLAKIDPPQKKGKVFRMRIIEGDKVRFVDFWEDENGQFVPEEVNRTELNADQGRSTPPRPQANKQKDNDDN